MIIAVAEGFDDVGLDIGKHMFVQAIDKSETAYKMAYLQFAFRGIPAHVIWGDTLSLETYEHAYTPDAYRFHMRHGRFGDDPEKSRGTTNTVRKRKLPQSLKTKPPIRKRNRPKSLGE